MIFFYNTQSYKIWTLNILFLETHSNLFLEEDDNQEKKIYDLDGSENEESGSDIENDVVVGENGALDDTMGTDEEILDEQEEFDGDALEG